MEPDFATEALLLMCKNGGAGPHQHMLTAGTTLPLWALGVHKHRGPSTHRGKAEVCVDPQELELHDFRSGAEIWAVSCWFWRIYAIDSFVSSEPMRHSSRLLVLPGLGGSGIISCQDKQRPGHGLDWPFRPHRGSWCLTSGPGPAYLCWWTGEHSAWGTSGLIACVLILRKGRGQCQQEHTSWACTTDVDETTEHTPRDSSWEEHLVALSPVQYLTLTYLTPQLRNGSRSYYCQQLGADPTPNRAVTTTEQNGGLIQHPRQALITTCHTH